MFHRCSRYTTRPVSYISLMGTSLPSVECNHGEPGGVAGQNVVISKPRPPVWSQDIMLCRLLLAPHGPYTGYFSVNWHKVGISSPRKKEESSLADMVGWAGALGGGTGKRPTGFNLWIRDPRTSASQVLVRGHSCTGLAYRSRVSLSIVRPVVTRNDREARTFPRGILRRCVLKEKNYLLTMKPGQGSVSDSSSSD